MKFSFGDVIGTASLLFGLVGLLGTFFFVSLTQWLSSVLATRATWRKLIAHDPDGKQYGPRLDCYHKAKESRSFVTIIAWFVITAFLWFVTEKLQGLKANVAQQSWDLLAQFVIEPCRIFFFVYFVQAAATRTHPDSTILILIDRVYDTGI